jgi:hypothetical protein
MLGTRKNHPRYGGEGDLVVEYGIDQLLLA